VCEVLGVMWLELQWKHYWNKIRQNKYLQ
jgi:hypothetical protein